MSTKVGKKQSAIAAAVTISYMILASSSVVFLDMGLQQAFGGTFPGTNGKIAFDSDRTGTEQIFVMNADGSGQTNLSNNAFNDNLPDWGPLAAPRQGQTVGGIIEPIDMTSLFIAGIFTNAFWMVPTLGGIAGAIVALFNVKRKRDD